MLVNSSPFANAIDANKKIFFILSFLSTIILERTVYALGGCFQKFVCYQLLFQSTRHHDYYAEWDKYTTTVGRREFQQN